MRNSQVLGKSKPTNSTSSSGGDVVTCDVSLPYRMYVASLHFVFTLFGVSCRDNVFHLEKCGCSTLLIFVFCSTVQPNISSTVFPSPSSSVADVRLALCFPVTMRIT